MLAGHVIMFFCSVSTGNKPSKSGKREHPPPARVVHEIQIRIGMMIIPLITHVNPRHSETVAIEGEVSGVGGDTLNRDVQAPWEQAWQT